MFKNKKLIGMAVLCCLTTAAAQKTSQIIYSRWGNKIHRPYALERAVQKQTLAAGLTGFEMNNRREAAGATVRLSEVVSLDIQRTTVGDDFVVNLIDVDGNTSSIWVKGNSENKWLDVTGVEPY